MGRPFAPFLGGHRHSVVVASDAPNFGLIQTVIAILLVIGFLGAAVFWQTISDRMRRRR